MSDHVKMPPISTVASKMRILGGPSLALRSRTELPWQGYNQSSQEQSSLLISVLTVAKSTNDSHPIFLADELGPFAGLKAGPPSPRVMILISGESPDVADGIPNEPELSNAEKAALRRETELRAAGSPEVADQLPSDDDSWRGYNTIRHALIKKELSAGLTPVERALLGTVELLSDRRIRKETQGSLDKARELLAKLDEA